MFYNIILYQVQYRTGTAGTTISNQAPVKQQSNIKPPQALLQSENTDITEFSNNLSLEDIMKQVVDSTAPTTTTSSPTTNTSETEKEPKVIVRFNYCTYSI